MSQDWASESKSLKAQGWDLLCLLCDSLFKGNVFTPFVRNQQMFSVTEMQFLSNTHGENLPKTFLVPPLPCWVLAIRCMLGGVFTSGPGCLFGSHIITGCVLYCLDIMRVQDDERNVGDYVHSEASGCRR